jgi:hypothetical protein
MSSQGVPGTTGYTYQILRDAQDHTRQIREQLTRTSYEDGSKQTFPTWDKTGNGFRLSYNFGRLSCAAGTADCPGVGLSDVVPLVSGPRDLLSYLNYAMYNAKSDHVATPDIDDPGTWGIYDDTLLMALLTSDVDDDMGSSCRRSNPGTIIPRKVDGTYNWDYYNLYVTGFYTAPMSGSYVFFIESDDGITIKLNGTTIISHPGYSAGGGSTSAISLVGGTKYPLEMLWTNGNGGINLCITMITVDGSTEIQDTYPFTHSCSPA